MTESFLTNVCGHLNKFSSPRNILRAIQLVITILERDQNDGDGDLELDQSENMGTF